MTLLFALIFFILGLIIGSFLNVVILRLNTNKSLGGRSACMSCMNKLSWYELIPLFSFLSLRGRCRSCKTKISIQYPLVECVAGLIFALLFLKFQEVFFLSTLTFVASYAYYAFVFSLLIVIATYDLKHKIIPDTLSLIFGLSAFFGMFIFYGNNAGLFFPHVPTILDLFSGLFTAFPFAFFWLISGGRWMGLGDAKLALGIGWLLGPTSAFSGLMIAFWSGAIVGIGLIVFSKVYGSRGGYAMKSEIPFAPFLVLGAIIVFFLNVNFFGI